MNTLEFLLLLEGESKERFCCKGTSFISQSFSDFDDFSMLASNNKDFEVTLRQRLLVNRDHPPLHKNKYLLLLELFNDLGT